jgi:hypothetical protein
MQRTVLNAGQIESSGKASFGGKKEGYSMSQAIHDVGSGTVAAQTTGKRLRRLELLRRSGLFGEPPRGTLIRPACGSDDMRAVFRLVHDTFVEKGYILPQASGMRLRVHEATPELMTFIALTGGRIVGAISVVSDSEDLHLPSDDAFSEEIGHLRSAGLRLCEVTNQVTAADYRRSPVTTELMRCVMAHALRTNQDMILASVSPIHESFYDLIGFRTIGSVRSYSQKVEDPVILMGLDVKDVLASRAPGPDEVMAFMYRFLISNNPYLPYVEGWAILARHFFTEGQSLRALFVSETGFLRTCTKNEREAIRRRWGEEMFSRVMAESGADSNIGSPQELNAAAVPGKDRT